MQRVLMVLLGLAAACALGANWLGLAREAGPWRVFAATLLFGLPALFLCCKRRWWAWWQLVALGSLGGLLFALPFLGGRFTTGPLFVLFACAGAGFGLLFWLAAIWRNDDLTCPKSFCLPCGTVYKVARNALRR